MTDTTKLEAVTLAKDARMLKEAFSRCRRDVSIPQQDEHARNLAKRIGSGRVRIAEHMVTLAWDGFSREAPQDDVEAPGHIYLAIVRSWYAAKRRGERVDFAELMRGVLEAQSATTLAEFAVLADRCPKAIADLEEALTRDEIEIERQLEHVRELKYTSVAA